MFELKPLSREAIPAALDKAHRYRLLNEPLETESICLDILDVDPDNQQALIYLLLALTDQFHHELTPDFNRAMKVLERLQDEYSRHFYHGIICERRAKTHFDRGGFGSGHVAYDWFRQAMAAYEKAIEIRPGGNDDSILRWNTCARTLMRHPELVPTEKTPDESMLE